MVTKCLNSSRTKTKEKGKEILMVYIELEKQEQVMVGETDGTNTLALSKKGGRVSLAKGGSV